MKNKVSAKLLVIGSFGVLILAIFASPALAQTCTTSWTAGSGDWFDCAHNWSAGCPTPSSDACINNGGTAQINNNPNASARSLTLGSDTPNSGSVSVDGTNGGAVTVGDPDDPDENLGIVTVGYQGKGILSITNGGMITSGTSFIAKLPGGVMPGSNGTVRVDGVRPGIGTSSTWSVKGELNISGTSQPTVDGGPALLSVTNGAVVMAHREGNAPVWVWVGLSGTVTGNGTIRATGDEGFVPLTFVKGTIVPSGGTLTIDSQLRLDPTTATTVCNVTPSGADNVEVTRQALLGGRLSVTMTGTFTPGTTFTLLHADGGLNATTFGSVSIKYPIDQCFTPTITYDYNNNKVKLYLEPCT